MSEPAVEPADDDVSAPTARRGAAGVLAVVAVVMVGLVLGGLLALVLGGDEGADPPGDDEVRLALATQRGLDPDATACALAELDAAEALDDELAHRLVDDAVRGAMTRSAAVDDAVAACSTDRLLDALSIAGVPDPVATCATSTLADQPPAVQDGVAEQPLAAGRPGREVVAACALEHLATELEASTGIAGTDARCVAGGVLDRLGLEAVLSSIGALAVTTEVAAAATAAADACATG